METKHTKGKWVLSHGANTFPTIGSAELHQPIATIHKIENAKTFCEEAEANAKLIAAAPELLEALIKLYNSIDSCIDLTPELLIECNNAIKKATE